MAATLNTEQAHAIAIWKRAHKQGGLTIDMKNKRAATRLRFLLYEVRNMVRNQKLYDPELGVASNDCILRIENTVITIESGDNSEVSRILREAGFDTPTPETLQKHDEIDGQAAESQRKAMKLLFGGGDSSTDDEPDNPVQAPNPYYTRNQ